MAQVHLHIINENLPTSPSLTERVNRQQLLPTTTERILRRIPHLGRLARKRYLFRGSVRESKIDDAYIHVVVEAVVHGECVVHARLRGECLGKEDGRRGVGAVKGGTEHVLALVAGLPATLPSDGTDF